KHCGGAPKTNTPRARLPGGNALSSTRRQGIRLCRSHLHLRRLLMASSSATADKLEKPIHLLGGNRYRYFCSSFTPANAFAANSKSSRECAAETCVRTRAVPCGTTG